MNAPGSALHGWPGYSPLTVELFEHPRHAGPLLPADGLVILQGRAGSRESGAEIQVWLGLAGGRVATARFLAFGDPHVLAAASLAMERLEGRSLAELQTWSADGVARDLAVPIEKRGRLLILEDAVRAAARSAHALRVVSIEAPSGP